MSDPSTVDQVRLCIDANDVDVVGEFWIGLLGYTMRDVDEDDWRHLEPPMPQLPHLTIQPVPEGKTVKNRLHLDVFVTDPGPWIERAVELGGTLLLLNEEPDDWFQVIADPEGNEFCFCRS